MNPDEVPNQSSPRVDVDLYAGNRPLQDALAFHLPGFERERFEAMGAEFGSAAMIEHARLANAYPPRLHTHDRCGRRIDEVEFHPSYHALLASALRHGLHGTPWWLPAGAHVERAAAFMLFTELEPSVLCPVSMTYAAAPALRANAAISSAWSDGLASRRYDARSRPAPGKTALTMGMGMTEKQGGSDVRANLTRAEPDGTDDWGDRVSLFGHKWFFSAPMSDAHLVLAQEDAGLSCFFVPRWRRDGRRNGVVVQRLKDKLGNHANASSEVEFDAAAGWRVGEAGRGIAQILSMGALTRLDCALGSAGLMRHALVLALHHARERHAFGRRLVEHALMRNVLADLALESEAAMALALRLAAAVDHCEHAGEGGDAGAPDTSADAHEAAMRRVLTPIAKFWVCKRGSAFAQEAMECLGGNGYVEEGGQGVMARIYREMPLNSIWEGAGNIMALDLLRALRSDAVREALGRELAPLQGVHPEVDARLAALADGARGANGGGQGVGIDAAADEFSARRLAGNLAVLLQAALLRRHATEAVFDAFVAARLVHGGGSGVFGQLPPGLAVGAIIDRALP